MRDPFDEVAAHVREVSAEIIEPRWRTLCEGDIDVKTGPDDLVTIADLEAERALTERLAALLPAATVVGEEAVAADPSLLRALHGDEPVWLIDPIDGTGNFVDGSADYGVMVALVRQGTTAMAWIHRPATDEMVGAEHGGGAFSNGRRLRTEDSDAPPSEVAGVVKTRFLDEQTRHTLRAHDDRVGATGPGTMCAAVEYEDVANSRTAFVFYWRTYPWDHAPGALIVEEAGGRARRLDGSPYSASDNGEGLLVTPGPTLWQTVRTSLLAAL